MDTTMDSGGSGTGGGSSGRKRDRSPSPSSDASTSSSRSVVGGGHTSVAAATATPSTTAVDLHAGLLPNKEAGTRSDSLPSKPQPPLQENNTNAQTTTDEHVLQKEEHKEEPIVYNEVRHTAMFWHHRLRVLDQYQINFTSNIDPKFQTFIDWYDSHTYVGWHPRTWPKEIRNELTLHVYNLSRQMATYHPRLPLKFGIVRNMKIFPFDPQYDKPTDVQMFQTNTQGTPQGNK